MDVRDNGKFSGSKKKVTTKVAPIKVEYLFMTKQHYHSPKFRMPYICCCHELLLLLMIRLKS
jgi:hypothetical protein